ncbi:MAG TPA: TfoX/Sxy family protein [Vicinamibacterales bacterium]|jgi:DNA transformation protein
MTARKAKTSRSGRPSPLAVTDAFRSFVLDQLGDLGDVAPRSMFGGVGLYHRGVFFGIIAGDVLYLKVDDTNRPEYVKAGMKPFKPYPHRPSTMQYYAVPIDVLESQIELTAWARKSIAVAEHAPRRPIGR